MDYKTIKNIIHQCWKEVFEYEGNIDYNEDFFDLGGNSLLSNDMKNAINEKLNAKVDVEDIYKYTTINKISEYIYNHMN